MLFVYPDPLSFLLHFALAPGKQAMWVLQWTPPALQLPGQDQPMGGTS